MYDKYYIKVGRRYKEVKPFDGFPSDGVWVVKDMGRKSRLIIKLTNDIQHCETLIPHAITKDSISEIIVKEYINHNGKSLQDIADDIAERIIEYKKTK